MTITEALEIVRDQMFGLGTLDHNFSSRVDAMKVIQPVLEAAGKVDKERASSCVADWHESTHAARYCYREFLKGHDCGQVRDSLLALLAALPDEVKP